MMKRLLIALGNLLAHKPNFLTLFVLVAGIPLAAFSLGMFHQHEGILFLIFVALVGLCTALLWGYLMYDCWFNWYIGRARKRWAKQQDAFKRH